ncbi:hypothetical protein DBT_1806 [Dissulfuribacter thermophilus]|uniref:Cell division protein FtsL n=1 Tax=Dissulfuribacter thermophilus TaxID=1156395 RepID=A0A1B9F489_9BACT|nr:hypothetical protein [Dissulfuribacter thermophilus]OCC14746.1 hypothetical protein DBT_1806 [Dissulfuribacter thermophilus]
MFSRAASLKTARLQSTHRLRTRQRSGARSTISLREMGLIFISVVLFGLSVVTGYEIKSVSKEISTYREELKAFGEEEERLKGELARFTEKTRLEKIGRALGLHPPKKSQIVHIK